MRAAIYLRVSKSTKSRFGDELSFDQRPEVQEGPSDNLQKRRGWIITRVYIDRMSGGKESRPGLDEMMTDAARGRFDVLIVWRFDQLSRSAIHFLQTVERLQALGVDFISHEQALDTTTATGKFTLTMFAAVAELEQSVVRSPAVPPLCPPNLDLRRRPTFRVPDARSIPPKPENSMMQRRATRLVTTLPFEMRRDLVILGRKHNDEYRGLMSEDRGLREAAARFYRSLLPSPRRRGRPRDETTSRACDLLATLSVTHPDWPPSRRWGRVYPSASPNTVRCPMPKGGLPNLSFAARCILDVNTSAARREIDESKTPSGRTMA